MSIYRNHIYPYLVSRMGDPKPIQEIRQRLVRLAEGTVLEIGAGSGANFVHYDPARVTKLYALAAQVVNPRHGESATCTIAPLWCILLL